MTAAILTPPPVLHTEGASREDIMSMPSSDIHPYNLIDAEGQPFKRQYRILAGRHIESVPINRRNSQGEQQRRDMQFRARMQGDTPDYKGDVFESDVDMLNFNQPGMPPKFELIGAHGTAQSGRAAADPLAKLPNETGEQYAARLDALVAAAKAKAQTQGSQPPPPVRDMRRVNAVLFDRLAKLDFDGIMEWAQAEEIKGLEGAESKDAALSVIKEVLDLV